MRRFLQRLLTKPLIRLSDKYSSRPNRERVHSALSELYKKITNDEGNRGLVIPFNAAEHKFVIFSDQHKGARDGSDDFLLAEKNYLEALKWYNANGYFYINLGDSEELWENLFITVKRHNKSTFEHEKAFLNRNAFLKIFGNHDLYWDNDPLAAISLLQLYSQRVKVYEGAVLQTEVNGRQLKIYLTHGHQGDLQSDGNWFSKWFVSNVWAPLQAYLKINPNTPAYNETLKTDHNRIMYDWSAQQENILLITGHTHQPVFRSLTHLERLYYDLDQAKTKHDEALIAELEKQITLRHIKRDSVSFAGYHPSYFNTGCCCFDDGDITGIEIENGCIRLIKWEYDEHGNSKRVPLEEARLETLMDQPTI
jgi:predicted phosphodiesterase